MGLTRPLSKFSYDESLNIVSKKPGFWQLRLKQGCHWVRKTKKNDKSQVKMGVFEKLQEIKKKTSDFVCSNLLNSLYLKAFDW